MKHFLFLLFATMALSAKAGDTLTRAQVYNFNVGDTFDYEEHSIEIDEFGFPISETINFSRTVVTGLNYSANGDSLFVLRKWVYPLPVKYDTLVIDSLQYPAVLIGLSSPICNIFQSQFIFDSTSIFNGGILNTVDITCAGDYPITEAYSEGLGKVDSINGSLNVNDVDSLYLIYYSKGPEHWGTPYYAANQSNLVHYTPIPEECASWININISPALPSFEKIITGERVPFNGHTYVEMLYSNTNDSETEIATSDSLLGYFRNDTINQKAYFYNKLDTIPFEIYDFSVPVGGAVIGLSQIMVGGQVRTVWNEGCELGSPNPGGYIEGVGGRVGLCLVGSFDYSSFNEDYYLCGSLTCFSVCGEVQYSDSSYPQGVCDFPAAITPLTRSPQFLKLFQTINSGQFNVQVTDPSQHNIEFSILDLSGRMVKSFTLNNSLNSLNISNCAAGFYIWQALSDNKLMQTGKLVKE